MFFGSHVNKHKSEGWFGSLAEVLSYGGNVAQVFVSSPIGKMSAASFKDLLKQGPDIKAYLQQHEMKLFIHSSYTLNFSKDPEAEAPYWIDAMVREMEVANAIGAEGCVLHLGKAVTLTQKAAEDNMFRNVCTLLDKVAAAAGSAKLFLETSSGQGSEILPTVNNDMSALAAFFAKFPKKYHARLSFCVDTCHIFAAGYDISTKAQAGKFIKEWDEKIGIQHLGVVHFNNSVHEVGARKDRHACIAYGKIPLEGLIAFGISAMRRGIPVILETPDGPKEIPLLKEMTNHTTVSESLLKSIQTAYATPALQVPAFAEESPIKKKPIMQTKIKVTMKKKCDVV